MRAFDEVKTYGRVDRPPRTAEQTATRVLLHDERHPAVQQAARDLATAKYLGLLQTARLFAMVNTVSADALMSTLNQKYHFLFWRPVTAIDPTSVTADGFGPVADGIRRRQPGDRRADRAGGRSCRRPTTPSTRERTERTRQPWRRCSASSSAPTRSISTSTVRPTSLGESARGAALRHRGRTPHRRRERPHVGRPPLPLLHGSGGAARTEGRALRPQSRLQGDRLILGSRGAWLVARPSPSVHLARRELTLLDPPGHAQRRVTPPRTASGCWVSTSPALRSRGGSGAWAS